MRLLISVSCPGGKEPSAGNLGKVFDLDWNPEFGTELALENFSQLMTVSSGGVDLEVVTFYLVHPYNIHFRFHMECFVKAD